jgi:hypothetical protein
LAIVVGVLPLVDGFTTVLAIDGGGVIVL